MYLVHVQRALLIVINRRSLSLLSFFPSLLSETSSRITDSTRHSLIDIASAGAAASLAHAKSRPHEVWKPEAQPHAEIAALHARDHQLAEQQEVKPSADGFKAALLAVREQRAGSASGIPPDDLSGRGGEEKAKTGRTGASYDAGSDQRQRAVQAAAGALLSQRRRSDSALSVIAISAETPLALSAAEASHRERTRGESQGLRHLDIEPALEASRILHMTNVNPQLYTSAPPVSLEVEESRKLDVRRAAATSMAREMYAVTQLPGEQTPNLAVQAARREHRRAQSQRSLMQTEESASKQGVALHQTAQRLAAERLARMQNEMDSYQNYYGTAPAPATPLRSRLSLRRKRAVSDADASQVDLERSLQIRDQMSSLQSKLNEVDEQRLKDRDLLMQAARRNVDAAIHDMDLRVYAEKGKPSPAMQKEWEEKAQERARQESELESVVAGQVNIGTDRYMDLADVEAVARSRLQPTFDGIDEHVEERRARELEQRLDAEQKQRHAAIERQREADLKTEEKRQRGL